MSKLSEQARDAAREKVDRLTRTPKGDVDASGWREPLGEQGMQPGLQTGPRPVSRRQFRRGGKVPGLAAAVHHGRKPRSSGGVTKTDGGLINTDVKECNEAREGPKHVGGMKSGGRAHKAIGGGMIQPRPMPAPAAMPGRPRPVMAQPMGRQFARGGHVKGCECSKCMGGRVKKASGGGLNYTPADQRHIKREYDANVALAKRTAESKPKSQDWFQHQDNMTKPKKAGGRVGRDAGGRLPMDLKNVPVGNYKPSSMPARQLAQSAMRMTSKGGTDPYDSQPAQAENYRKLWNLKGGRPARSEGGQASYGGTRPVAGRIARKSGGRSKSGTKINIIIASPGGARGPMPPPGMTAPPPGGPIGMRQGMPPVMPPGGAPPPMGAMPPPGAMPRKHGGRTGYPIRDGAGGGKGRLQKIAAYGS
jgi:hypothetical protein